MDQILARLDLDANFSINSKIVKLISNSFFPLNDDLDEAVKIERAIYLVKENRDAARKFYRLFEKRLDLHQIVKFMLAVLIHLKRFVKSEMENSVDNISLAEESQDETEDNNLPGNYMKSWTMKTF